MLLTANGYPSPSTAILERLKHINPQLGLKFMRRWDGEVWWAVTFSWLEGDPRWKTVAMGETPREDACDIYAYIPIDCPVDDVPGYLEQQFKRFDKKETRMMLDRMHGMNLKSRNEAGDRLIEKTLEHANPRTLFKNELGELPKPVSVLTDIS